MIKIAPSMLSANFATLSEEIKSIELAGADLLHIDIMDGHFVPNLTFGAPIVKAIRPYTQLPFDVHLMVTDPKMFADVFMNAGADQITFHVETIYDKEEIKALAKHIHDQGKKAGLTLKPQTPIEVLKPFLHDFDLFLNYECRTRFWWPEVYARGTRTYSYTSYMVK